MPIYVLYKKDTHGYDIINVRLTRPTHIIIMVGHACRFIFQYHLFLVVLITLLNIGYVSGCISVVSVFQNLISGHIMTSWTYINKIMVSKLMFLDKEVRYRIHWCR